MKNGMKWRLPAQTIMDADYANEIAILANIPSHAEFLLHCLEQATGGTGFHVSADKTEYMHFNKKRRHLHPKRGFTETNGRVHLPGKQRLI